MESESQLASGANGKPAVPVTELDLDTELPVDSEATVGGRHHDDTIMMNCTVVTAVFSSDSSVAPDSPAASELRQLRLPA